MDASFLGWNCARRHFYLAYLWTRLQPATGPKYDADATARTLFVCVCVVCEKSLYRIYVVHFYGSEDPIASCSVQTKAFYVKRCTENLPSVARMHWLHRVLGSGRILKSCYGVDREISPIVKIHSPSIYSVINACHFKWTRTRSLNVNETSQT